MTRAVIRLPALVLGALLACCTDGREPPAAAADPDLLLEIDGLRLTRAEFEPLDAYLRELDPKLGRKTRGRALLEQHFLPLLVARRAFPERRAELRRQAEGLVSVAGNARELAARGATAGSFFTDEPLYRNELPIAAVAWAFQHEHLGAVSPPIEVPRGFLVIGPEDLESGITQARDRIRAYIVPFMLDEATEFDRWLRATVEALRGRATYIHPDLEGALPEWLVD